MVVYRQPFTGDYPITQPYGMIVPGVTYKDKPHTGIDYGCPEGTPVLASADGVVQYCGNDPAGYGKHVIILHNDNKATLYAHLSDRNVVLRQKVKQGDVIGHSGNTGCSTGPHLHFEARKVWNDWRSHQDPVTFLPLMNFADVPVNAEGGIRNAELKDAEAFQPGDDLVVTAPLGCKAFRDGFHDFTVYPCGSRFRFTGDTQERNGYTYMEVVPMQRPVWIAVNDHDTQILDKSG